MSLDDTMTVSPPARRASVTASGTPAQRPLVGQLLRFAVVGVLNTAISLAVYKVGVDIGIPYPVASVVAFTVGAVNSYTLNRIWTFRAGGFSRTGFARYLVVQLVGLGINEIVLVGVVEGLTADRLIAQAIALVVASSTMFMLNRHWAFAHRACPPEEPVPAERGG